MNLAQISNDRRKSLSEGRDCIGFFVHKGRFFWLIDWEAHFNLDHDKNLIAYYEKGFSSKEELDEDRRKYRAGIPTLDIDQFEEYLSSGIPQICSAEQLSSIFFAHEDDQLGRLSQSIQDLIVSGHRMPDELITLRNWLSVLLPKFYVNFDRRIFIHMVRGRSYDNVVPENWWGAEGDFEHMVPVAERYWQRSISEDFWALTNL